MFAIIGYDKDGDIYEEYGYRNNASEAIEIAKNLTKKMLDGDLKTAKGEPIDWIAVYENWENDEKKIWASYENV